MSVAPAPLAARRMVRGLAAIAMAAIGVTLVELWLTGTSIEPGGLQAELVARAILVVLAIAVGVMWLTPISNGAKALGTVIAIGAFLTLVLFVALLGTPYGMNGVTGDAGFRTALVTHSARYTFPFPDLSYADLPSWYSPVYYWVLGKIAWIGGIPPYKMLKFGALAVTFLLPLAAFAAWRFITRDTMMALAAAASLLIAFDTYKVLGWLVVVVFVPWWVFFIDGGGAGRFERRWPWYLTGGALGGLIFAMYPFYFAVGGLALVVGWVVYRWVAPLAHEPARNQLLILLVAAIASSPYWLAFLISVAVTGGTEVLSTRWYEAWMAAIPLPFFEPSVTGVLTAAGIGWLALNVGVSRVARSMLSLVVAAYLWVAVVTVSGAFGRPMHIHRFDILVVSILAIAGLFGVVQFGRFLRTKVDRAGMAVIGMALLGLFVFLGQEYIEVQLHGTLHDRAHAARVPEATLSAFESAVGEPDGQVVLTAEHELTVYLPVFLWNSWNANFAHPAGRFNDRVAFLEELSRIDDPESFAAAFGSNAFEPIDIALFLDTGETLTYWYTDENFPDDTIVRTIDFRRAQFDTAFWDAHTDGGYVVFTRRPSP